MFWQKRLKGKDFAELLVSKISKDIYSDWDGISSTVQKAVEEFSDTKGFEVSESCAPFMIMAVVVMDVQAARNLRGQHDYMMLRKHIFDIFSQVVEIDAVQELFSAYEDEFYIALNRGENPVTFGIAPMLYDLLKIPSQQEDGIHRSELQNPLVLGSLGDLLISHIGFTKFALQNYKVTF